MNVRRNISSPNAAGLVVVVLGHVVLDVRMLEVVRMNTSFGDRSFAAVRTACLEQFAPMLSVTVHCLDAFAKLLKTYLMNCM